jgi:hypothetical protein
MSRSLTAITALAFSLMFAAAASAQHSGDIFLDVVDGRIVTGEVNPDQSVELGVRVFAATFGDTGFPTFTQNPGFDCLPGTFPTGTANGFNALAGLTVWNDEGFEPADGERLRIAFGPLNVTLADEPIEGFTINVQSDGGWHRHLSYTILGPDDNTNPLPGIYLLELELYNTSASIEPSKPFWKVFNFGMSASIHQEAIAWVEANLFETDDCPADLNGDGVVDGADLLILLSEWGPCTGDCDADLNNDDVVDGADLLILLSAWGECP